MQDISDDLNQLLDNYDDVMGSDKAGKAIPKDAGKKFSTQ